MDNVKIASPVSGEKTFGVKPPTILNQKFTHTELVAIRKKLIDAGFTPGQSFVAIMAPIPQQKTAGGIFIPEQSLAAEEHRLRFDQFHTVMAVADNIAKEYEIKPLEHEIWISAEQAQHASCKIVFNDEIILLVVQFFSIAGVRKKIINDGE